MSKHIAVIGSSGGNLYNQGGSDPKAMMKEIFTCLLYTSIAKIFLIFRYLCIIIQFKHKRGG